MFGHGMALATRFQLILATCAFFVIVSVYRVLQVRCAHRARFPRLASPRALERSLTIRATRRSNRLSSECPWRASEDGTSPLVVPQRAPRV